MAGEQFCEIAGMCFLSLSLRTKKIWVLPSKASTGDEDIKQGEQGDSAGPAHRPLGSVNVNEHREAAAQR